MTGKTVYIACPNCGKFTPKNFLSCEKCGEGMPQPGTAERHPFVQPFRSGYFEHIALDPMYIGSRKQLRDETNARGLTSHYIH